MIITSSLSPINPEGLERAASYAVDFANKHQNLGSSHAENHLLKTAFDQLKMQDKKIQGLVLMELVKIRSYNFMHLLNSSAIEIEDINASIAIASKSEGGAFFVKLLLEAGGTPAIDFFKTLKASGLVCSYYNTITDE